jgi:hypothetical protein
MTERQKENDPELAAMTQVIDALEPLDDLARSRVLDYVFRRLGLKLPVAAPAGGLAVNVFDPVPALQPGGLTPGQTDIRTLKAAKKPKSASEMAAIVAYYLSELAPQTDRKDQIDAGDIKKYFKQADFPLPEAPSMTLIHTRNAGYLDAGAERGRYKLNPVGYNLVAHNLPSRAGAEGPKVKAKKKRRGARTKRR